MAELGEIIAGFVVVIGIFYLLQLPDDDNDGDWLSF